MKSARALRFEVRAPSRTPVWKIAVAVLAAICMAPMAALVILTLVVNALPAFVILAPMLVASWPRPDGEGEPLGPHRLPPIPRPPRIRHAAA